MMIVYIVKENETDFKKKSTQTAVDLPLDIFL